MPSKYRNHPLPAVAGRRQSDMASERDAECAGGAVADSLRNLGHVAAAAPEHVLCQGHTPGEEIRHRRDTYGTSEALEKN